MLHYTTQKMNRFIRLVSLVCALLIFSGCSTSQKSNEGYEPLTTEGGLEYTETSYSKQLTISPADIDDKYSDYTLFKDSDFYYYVIKIGRMYNVPADEGQKFRYDGISSKEISFTSKQLNLSIARKKVETSVNDHTEWSQQLEIPDIALDFAGKFAEKVLSHIELGSIYTNYQYGSSDYFESQSTENIDGTISVSEITQREVFDKDSNRPAGNWLYIFLTTVDVYASIITDKNHNVLASSTVSNVVNGNYDFVYIGESESYTENSTGDDFMIDFEDEAIKRIICLEPTIDITGTYSIILKTDEPVFCGKDKKFTEQAKDSTASLVDPKILQLEITGDIALNDKSEYIVNNLDGDGYLLLAKLMQDKTSINTNDSSYKSLICEDSETDVTLFGGRRKLDQKVGCGAFLAQVTLKNGKTAFYSAQNIFGDINRADTVSLLDLLLISPEDMQNMVSMDCAIIFEIRSTKDAFGGSYNPLNNTYTDWKYEFSIRFASN